MCGFGSGHDADADVVDRAGRWRKRGARALPYIGPRTSRPLVHAESRIRQHAFAKTRTVQQRECSPPNELRALSLTHCDRA